MSTKILYVTHEMDPYSNLTEVSKIARVLPQSMQEKGMEVRVFMPRYGKINERKHRLHEVIRLSGINITVDDEDNPLIIKVASLPLAKIQIYFLDNEDLFHRKHYLKDDDGNYFEDNDIRSLFFNKGVIEIATKLGWEPDIIHCHGWMTNLVPFLAKTKYKNEPVFKNSKIVYSTYANEFDESLSDNYIQKAHIDSGLSDALNLINPNCADLYKIGVTYADAIVNSSGDSMPELNSYIDSLDKPVLKHEFNEENEEEYIEANRVFYEGLF